MNRLLLVAALLVAGPIAHAGLVFSGTFNIELATGALGVDSLTGDFSFSLDDSAAPGDLTEFFDDLPLDNFTLTSTIGGVAFTAANSGGFVDIRDSEIFAFGIGGFVSGVGTVVSDTTDFIIVSVLADPAPFESFALISIEGSDELDGNIGSPDSLFELNTQIVNTSAQRVPIPATLPLLGFGMLMLRLRSLT